MSPAAIKTLARPTAIKELENPSSFFERSCSRVLSCASLRKLEWPITILLCAPIPLSAA
jgi:hypothetical protein